MEFLLGQAIGLQCQHTQLARNAQATIETIIQCWEQDSEPMPDSTFGRFIRGDFTKGVPPREWITMHEPLQKRLLTFHAVLEMLRINVDGRQEIKQPTPTSFRGMVKAGNYGPFALVTVEGKEEVICWRCKETCPKDIAANLKPVRCPSCEASSVSDGT